MPDGLSERFKWVDRVSKGAEEKLSPEKRQMLIAEIEIILAKATSGMASSEDLAKARRLNKQLGSEFSSQIAEMEQLVEKAREQRNINSVSIMGEMIDPITSADSYFNREEVKIARQALSDIEGGKDVDDNIFIKMIEYLVSDDEDKLREETVANLAKERQKIINEAISGNKKEFSRDELARLEKTYNQESDLIHDRQKGAHVREVVKPNKNTGLKRETILAKKHEVKEALVEDRKQNVDSKKNYVSSAAEELEDLKQLLSKSHSKEEQAKKTGQIFTNKQEVIERAAALMREHSRHRNEVLGIRPAQNAAKEQEKKREDKPQVKQSKVSDKNKGSTADFDALMKTSDLPQIKIKSSVEIKNNRSFKPDAPINQDKSKKSSAMFKG